MLMGVESVALSILSIQPTLYQLFFQKDCVDPFDNTIIWQKLKKLPQEVTCHAQYHMVN